MKQNDSPSCFTGRLSHSLKALEMTDLCQVYSEAGVHVQAKDLLTK